MAIKQRAKYDPKQDYYKEIEQAFTELSTEELQSRSELMQFMLDNGYHITPQRMGRIRERVLKERGVEPQPFSRSSQLRKDRILHGKGIHGKGKPPKKKSKRGKKSRMNGQITADDLRGLVKATAKVTKLAKAMGGLDRLQTVVDILKEGSEL